MIAVWMHFYMLIGHVCFLVFKMYVYVAHPFSSPALDSAFIDLWKFFIYPWYESFVGCVYLNSILSLQPLTLLSLSVFNFNMVKFMELFFYILLMKSFPILGPKIIHLHFLWVLKYYFCQTKLDSSGFEFVYFCVSI